MPAAKRTASTQAPTTRRSRLQAAPHPRVFEFETETTDHPIELFIARFLFLALSCAFAFGGFSLVTDPSLGVTVVDVRGAYYLDAADVARATGVVGLPLFQVSSEQIRGKVLSLGVPRDLSVRFRPPNVVVVALQERTASYLWKAGGITFAVADDGVVLGRPVDLSRQVVVATDGGSVKPGDRVDPSILREAGYLATALPTVAGFTPVAFMYSKDLGLSFAATRGVQVVVGDDQLLDRKVAAVPPTLTAALSQPVTPKAIDVRVPSRPIMR